MVFVARISFYCCHQRRLRRPFRIARHHFIFRLFFPHLRQPDYGKCFELVFRQHDLRGGRAARSGNLRLLHIARRTKDFWGEIFRGKSIEVKTEIWEIKSVAIPVRSLCAHNKITIVKGARTSDRYHKVWWWVWIIIKSKPRLPRQKSQARHLHFLLSKSAATSELLQLHIKRK